MLKKLFEEVQTYKQSRNFWFLLTVFTLVVFTPLLYLTYGQLVLGEVLGRRLNSDVVIVASIIVVFVWGIVLIALFSVKLQIYVDSDGIHYKPASEKPSWVTISKHELLSFEVRKKRRTIFDTGALSFHKKYKCSYVILRGNVHLELTLNNNRKVLLGTGRPEEFERAIRKMMETTAQVYHG